jgi:hypothetical protein
MAATRQTDEERLAALGYKQEFQREFSAFEVRVSYSCVHSERAELTNELVGIRCRVQYHWAPPKYRQRARAHYSVWWSNIHDLECTSCSYLLSLRG